MADPAPKTLDRLARAEGIASRWVDIWGEPHEVDECVKRALLASMGVDVGNEETAARALLDREERTWRRTLEPVQVVRPPFDRIPLAISVDAAETGRSLPWILTLEDGSRVEGAFRPGDAECVGARTVDGRRIEKRVLSIGQRPAPGYHRLAVGSDAETRIVVAPESCFTTPGLREGGRVWGPAIQLYALRSSRNWGMGDLGDLRAAVELFGDRGAGIVGINPLHTLFHHEPERCSPYSPSSRAFLNDLYIDVEAVAEFEEPDRASVREQVLALREAEHVDYAGVAAVKRPLLERMYRRFRERHLLRDTSRGREFARFRDRGGALLEGLGTFEALQEDLGGDWRAWPVPFRHPDAAAVQEFSRAHRERIGFFLYLQWLCDEQLAAVARAGRQGGLEIGLYRDLAVGASAAGFEGWWYQNLLALDTRVGAPPDDFNLKGQDWGLPPWIPSRLREARYEPFIRCLRANMQNAGALRIDHVMGLMRLFCIPPGATPTRGAYLHYPFEDLLGILALESERAGCLVVGEDLGTVPDEVRAALEPLGVLSYRLLYFSRQADGGFAPPESYPRQALVAVGTQDLPTLAGWWEGRDVALRHELNLFPREGLREEQLAQRATDRTRLLRALGLGTETDEMTPELATAVHGWLARAPASVLTVQLEDVLGQQEQVNLPGTTGEHPNWRRKLASALEDLAHDPRLDRLAGELNRVRGRGMMES